MARVTVEDCVLVVPNRFELVALASCRAKHIASGSPVTVARDNDKDPVIALREIADNTINAEKLREALVTGLQRRARTDVITEDSGKEADSEEIAREVEMLTVPDQDEEAGFSFAEDNLDADD